jgi:hypothetical protein
MEAGSSEKPTGAAGSEAEEKSAGGSQDGSGGKPTGREYERPRLLRWGVVGLAVIVGLFAWLSTRDGGSSEPAGTEAAAPPRIVDVAQLREAAAALGQPIYWAGPVAGTELELRELGEGGVQVSYQPEGTAAGQGSRRVLTVGSYPLPDPGKALEGFAGRPGAIVRHAAGGREAVSSETTPTSVYFASPDNSVQVEVYDPSPQRAMGLTVSGRVQPAG